MAEIGYCGDVCSCCPRYTVTRENNTKKLKEVAQMWKRVGWRDTVLSTEEIKCGGCKTVTWCRYSEIRECAINHEFNNCGECDQYPCKKLKSVFEKTASYAEKCKAIFNEKDSLVLSKAFFTKKQNLDVIHQDKKG